MWPGVEDLILTFHSRLLILAGMQACLASSCCGPGRESQVVESRRLSPFDCFLEAARFSLPNTESWWFVLPADEGSAGEGARRVLFCGSDFSESEIGSTANNCIAVCVWDYEGRTVPSGSELERLAVPHSIGASSWLGVSLLGAAGALEAMGRRVVVDNRFVVASNSEHALSQALERRGRLLSLEGSALSRLPEASREVVLRKGKLLEDGTQREIGMACVPESRSLIVFGSINGSLAEDIPHEPIFIDSVAIHGRVLPAGWIECRCPETTAGKGVAELLALHMLLMWGVVVWI